MSSNDKTEKQNRMFVEKRQLVLARQELDRQLERKQSQLRREVEMLTDQFLDQRAFDGTRMYPKKSIGNPTVRSTKLEPTKPDDPSEKLKESDVPEEQYKSLDIYEKFVLQKRKYYPSYLKRPARVNKTAPELEGINHSEIFKIGSVLFAYKDIEQNST